MDFLQLDNFRLFSKKEPFKLAPITFLTGKNNSGKSTLIKSVLLLSDYLSGNTDQSSLSFNGKFSSSHKINCFGNAINWGSENKSFSIEFEHDEYFFSFKFAGEENETKAPLQYFSVKALEVGEELTLKRLSPDVFQLLVPQRFFDFIARPQQINLFDEVDVMKQVDEIRDQIKKLNSEKKSKADDSKAIIDILSEKQRLQTRLNLLKKQIKSGMGGVSKDKPVYQTDIHLGEGEILNHTISSIIRRGLTKYFESTASGSAENEYKALFKFYDFLRIRLNLSAEHLSPNRFYQSRLYFKQSHVSEINEVLFKYAINKPRPHGEAHRFLEKWLKEFNLGEEVKVEIIEGNSCKVEIKQASGKYVNISDMGFGPGQLLTILLSLTDIINKRTLLDKYQRPQLGRNIVLLIEEPEANLHPQFQSKLMELFYDVYKNYHLSLIIETHSEYLIRNTQVKVKELGKDHPFKIYYFNSNNSPFEMKYREDGIFENDFGPGFFDESANLTFELL
jgi:predicted ATPase